MKKVLGLILAAALCVGCSTTRSWSADVLVKATPKAQADFWTRGYTGSGFYFGLYTIGGGGSVNATVPGVGSASLTTTSASIGINGGYAWSNTAGTVFFACEGMFGWQNFNGNTAGFALSGPASFEQRCKAGTPLNNVLSLLPSWNLGTVAPLPSLPAGVTAGNVHPYLMAGIHEDDISVNFGLANGHAWRVAPSIGLGAITQLSNGTAVDVWAETIFPEKGTCVGVTFESCGNIGQQVKAGIAILW